MKKALLLLLAFPFIAFAQQQNTGISLVQQPATGLKFEEPNYTTYFQEAYDQNPNIPRGLLEAVAYGNTHIFHIVHNAGGNENCMGLPLAYGVMGLTLDGKNYFKNNLVTVSDLSGIPTNLIINSPEKNILAYASAFNTVMNSIASQKPAGTKTSDIIFSTLVALSELPSDTEGQIFALNTQLYSYFTFLNAPEFQEKYNFPNHDFDLQTLFGEDNYIVLSSTKVTVSEEEISDNQGNIYKSTGNNAPSVQSADYAPAIWNAAASCNYSTRGQAITGVVIHDVEGSYASCISWFQNCNANVSAHYVVRSSDGQITQMVLESKKAWHVGNSNPFTIGIEHEGYNTQTGWYTPAMYQSSANLVKDICISGYGINPTTCWSGVSCNGSCVLPLTVKIKGHQHYPSQTHNDPGVNWNWGTYYSLINGSTTCTTPTGLNATSITLNSATLNWASVSTATSYNVQYKLASGSTWTTLTSVTTSIVINGLNASTTYQYKVQAVCSSTGGYSPVASFATPATVLTNDNCANAEAIYPNTTCVPSSGDVAGATASGLGKASCDAFGGTPKLFDVWYKFQATATSHTIKVSPSASFDAVVALHTTCTGGQIGCADNGGGSGAAETIVSNVLTIGATYYIRVYSYGSSIPTTTSFDICVIGSNVPSCGTPFGLSATAITVSGATLNWSAISGATSYNVQYKKSSSSTWTTISAATNSHTISGLTISTAYDFKIQAVCSSAGTYSSVSTFTTAASTSYNPTITIGTATTPYSAHPFGTVYMDERVQYIFKKAELTTAGWNASSPYLKSIAFYVSSVSPQAMSSFKITMAHTSGASFTSTSFLSGTNNTTVYTGTVNVVQGWNTFTFSTPFTYNGTSNLLMSICWDNNSFTVNSPVLANSYSSFVALYYRADLVNSGACAKITGTQSYYRPNAKLEFSSTLSVTPPSSLAAQEGQDLRSLEIASTVNEPVFEIFPNPLDGGVIYGKLTETENKEITIKMYDLLGRELLSKQVNVEEGNFSLSFDNEQLKTGVYMVVGLTDTGRFTKKVLVK
ncbi:MAG: N-acetylmuramoyl-L-alanine amidase [Bacteroidia bacterium]|nr:N-acetylmuramoyl-L-alanine amidase [Bacteroidia bacterium]